MRLVGVVAAASATKSAIFDLTTGTVVSVDGGTGISDVRCEPVGNGWYRCSAVITVTTGNTITPRVYYQTVISGTTFSYQGDGVSGIHLWGPQLEVGSSLTSYIPTLTNFTSRSSTATYLDQNGLMRTAAVNVARTNAYKYDDNNVLQPVGTLTERASATNSVKYSNEWTNATWTKAVNVAMSTDGSLAPDGSVAQKFTLSGTTGHEVWQTIPALTIGTTYTFSVWVKPIGAIVPGFQIAYYDGGSIVNSVGISNQVVGQWKRYSFTFTPSVTPAAPRIRLVGFSAGLDGSSFYMFNAQIEAGTYPTSDIFTGAAAVTRSADVTASTATIRAADVYTSSTATRAADVVTSPTNTRPADSVVVNNLSPWFNQTEGTLTTEFVRQGPVVAGTFYRPSTLSAAPGSGEIGSYINGTTNNIAGFISNGTDQMNAIAAGAPVYTTGEIRTVAIGYKANSSAFSTKGGIGTDNTVILPTVVSLQIGAGNNGGNRITGYIRSVNYYPRRLTDSELQVIAL
ncbi:Carbohydrate binding domain protein [compost metagenome]